MSKKLKVPTLKEIEDNFSEWVDDPERFEVVKKRNEQFKAAVKEGKINMRVNNADLLLLMLKADEKGMGYQTLLSSLIHLYVNDKLVDVSEVRKVVTLPKKIGKGATTKKRA
ncbi:hypothetical protein [Bdellovibrio sp. HCB274]|uniref:hypothetical protein n=1 Tax=Bdellovibrio sp. HCB274 TaxID=3394361 RepID=UPI0039B55967